MQSSGALGEAVVEEATSSPSSRRWRPTSRPLRRLVSTTFSSMSVYVHVHVYVSHPPRPHSHPPSHPALSHRVTGGV